MAVVLAWAAWFVPILVAKDFGICSYWGRCRLFPFWITALVCAFLFPVLLPTPRRGSLGRFLRSTIVVVLSVFGTETLVLGTWSTIHQRDGEPFRIWEPRYDRLPGRAMHELEFWQGSLRYTVLFQGSPEILKPWERLFGDGGDRLGILDYGIANLSTDPPPAPGMCIILWSMKAPFWVVAAILLSYPAVSVARGPIRRRHRRRRGECEGCGYNLTGNTTGVCPECGSQTPAGFPNPSANAEPPTR